MKSEVYNRDCLEAMREMSDKAFDLAVVDPPYGIGNFHNKEWNGRPYNKVWDIPWNDKPPTAEYFFELYRVAKNLIVWGVNYYSGHVKEVGRIVWDKGNESGIGSDCELASQFQDKRVVRFKLHNTGFCGEARGQKIHPCQKPVALYRWLLTNYAKPGQTILDTHMGSQSSRIAAWDLGFDYCGYEIDADYFKAGCERFERHQAQGSLFMPEVAAVSQENLF